MEPETTTTPEDISTRQPRRHLTRARVLWGMVGLCLLFWAAHAIHRALQPQYQGKTAEEWYQSVSFEDLAFALPEDATNQPIVQAFQELGPDASHYLWREYNRKPSSLELWFGEARMRFTEDSNPFQHPSVAPMKAYFILNQIGPAAEPVIPELVQWVLRDEPDYPNLAAELLGSIRQQPETVLPALFESITMPSHNTTDRLACFKAIGMYGPAGSAYVPELQTRLTNSTVSHKEKIYIAAAILRITGEGKYLQQTVKAFFNQHQRYVGEDLLIIADLEELGPSALEITPILVTYAQSVPDTENSNQVARAIQAIDPKGIYHTP